MFSFLKPIRFSHLLKTTISASFAAGALLLAPAHFEDVNALSIAHPGGFHHANHKFHRHKFHRRKFHHRRHHHRRFHRRFHSGFHFGFHGPRYFGPRYYNHGYYGGGYPVVQPVPVAPAVICPIPVAPAPVIVPSYPIGGGGAVGPVYRVFTPGGC